MPQQPQVSQVPPPNVASGSTSSSAVPPPEKPVDQPQKEQPAVEYGRPAPPVMQVAEPAAPVYAAKPATAASPALKRPKLGLNMLQQIQEQSLQHAEHVGEKIELNQSNAEMLFHEFREYVRLELKQIPLAAQLDMMSIRFISHNELQIVCVTEVNQIYANNQREVFMDFAKKKTGIPDLRIMVHLDASARKEEVVERKLGKLEIFDLMVQQNPTLRLLKDGLNLQVE